MKSRINVFCKGLKGLLGSMTPKKCADFEMMKTCFIYKKQPLISVVLPVFNGEKHLRRSIESILSQTYDNFELLIINDGSTDGSSDIIDELAVQDQRIRRIDNSHNIGLARSLNKALKLCCGELIARQDQDDVSCPDRLLEQRKFLQRHWEVGIVGSAMEIIDEEGKSVGVYRQPETDCEIHFRMLFNNAMVHSSVMFRRYLLQKYGLVYDPRYENAEDYELWARLLRFTRAYNFQIPLVRYRITNSGISNTNPATQSDLAHMVSTWQLMRLDERLKLSWEEKQQMLEIFRRHLWGDLEGVSKEEEQVLPAMSLIIDVFIQKTKCYESRLLNLRQVLNDYQGKKVLKEIAPWRRFWFRIRKKSGKVKASLEGLINRL